MNILLTSAGRRSYLVQYFKEVLDGKGKVHASNSEWSTALEVADEAVITPLIYDDEYISFIQDYAQVHDIGMIISLFDIDLPILAQAKQSFKELGIHVIVSDYKVTQICNDKWNTYQFLKQNNLNAPKTFIELEQAQRALQKRDIQFPLIIKPRWGMGSISIFKADNAEELKVLYKKVKREVKESYVKYESQVDPEHAVIIQEYLNGQEYGLDIINDLEKNYVTTFVKKKAAMRSGETDGAITEKNEILEKTGEQIAKSLGHIANLDTDCFLIDGKPYVLEMNCRFGGGYPFSHLAGANLPGVILKWIDNEEGRDELKDYTIGVEGRKDMIIRSIVNHGNR
ncbi:ATP-grasp domain-containing protein [Rhodohalobacter barkolensis]|uniref:Carbamoyl phosphate synthase-like protein n=1 Tax=Rhodohalobacter barkolensis TaxID=2053187 RepID=A0A2N0VKC4_9BACT|nr:ATP-grasp domain-containing protein [Rhodohalobacter barkolensis]PKD44653.1 carbamoyl phosphate synthase-like protein [Rhodohalobacter barkolensis]